MQSIIKALCKRLVPKCVVQKQQGDDELQFFSLLKLWNKKKHI